MEDDASDTPMRGKDDQTAAIAINGPITSASSQTAPVASPFYGKVLLGDAFDLFDQLPEQSIDLIVTSPPYWGHREYGLEHNWEIFNDISAIKRDFRVQSDGYASYRDRNGVLGLEPYPEWYVSHSAEILKKAQRCLKMSGSMWINVGDTYFARWASIRENGRQGLADEGRFRRKTPMGSFRQEKQLLLIPSRLAISMQDESSLRNPKSTTLWLKKK